MSRNEPSLVLSKWKWPGLLEPRVSIKGSPVNEELFLLEQVLIGVEDIDPLGWVRCRQGWGVQRGMGAGASIL